MYAEKIKNVIVKKRYRSLSEKWVIFRISIKKRVKKNDAMSIDKKWMFLKFAMILRFSVQRACPSYIYVMSKHN
mgnify:CR=1 FL=1